MTLAMPMAATEIPERILPYEATPGTTDVVRSSTSCLALAAAVNRTTEAAWAISHSSVSGIGSRAWPMLAPRPKPAPSRRFFLGGSGRKMREVSVGRLARARSSCSDLSSYPSRHSAVVQSPARSAEEAKSQRSLKSGCSISFGPFAS